MKWRVSIVLFSTCLCLTLIAAGFWRQDWQYSLPVPRPADLRQVGIGSVVDVSAGGLVIDGNRPVLLHFFNPDCPCSRFNVDHLRELIRRFGERVRFVAVLRGESSGTDLRLAFAKLDLGIESIVDASGAMERQAGVYATPQAVLLERSGRLYFRGNYNLSRYCSAPETEFARIALESLLAGKPARSIAAAEVAYGCPLAKSRRREAEPYDGFQ